MGLAVGLPLFLTGGVSSMVDSAVGFLADLNTPLAMIVIGAQMAGADLEAQLYQPQALRRGRLPAAGRPSGPHAVSALSSVWTPMLYCANIILCAVPVAGATGMLAQRFEQDTAVAAQMVTLTTLLSDADPAPDGGGRPEPVRNLPL